jgi:DNA polymerase-3 subunit delta'
VLRRPWDARAKRHAAFIPVDEVRRLRGFLGHTIDAGVWRVVIVDSLDELNANAANALLKSLEEPPPRTVFLLLTAEPGRLLPTIRSRCRLLDLSPLPASDLLQAATAALAAGDHPAPQFSDQLLALAAGSVRRLLVLSHADGLKLHATVERILTALPQVDWSAAHALADELASPAAEQRFEIFCDLLLAAIARAVRAAATEQAQAGAGGLAQIISTAGPAHWAELWEGIIAEKADVMALNLDRRAFILGVLGRLSTASQV